MAETTNDRPYIDISKLVARTGLSRATLWRLKAAGKIPFYQPGGEGCRVTFPEDAIELAVQCELPNTEHNVDQSTSPKRLPGPRPKWMSPSNHEQ